MNKTDRRDPMESGYYIKEPVTSRYLQDSKKKYYLASVDQNVAQLKEEQVQNLTSILIGLKGEYDELKRESTIRSKETEQILKQIEMLEKTDKKTKNKLIEMEENYSNMESLIEMKRARRDQEAYTKTTYLALIDKLKDEVLILKKDIASLEIESGKLQKKYEKEKLSENIYREKINQVYHKISDRRMKNNHELNENKMIIQYYHNIINQKWSFIHSADDRRAKQIKIALQAKNDSQDNLEKNKRKMLFLYILYDKYLRKKMEKELKNNEQIEETFQTIKDITGTSSLKFMVDKISNKDKNYNLNVAKVTDKLSRISILNKDIVYLESEYQKLKTAVIDDNLNASSSETGVSFAFEDDETKLFNQEKELIEELKCMQEKHQYVRMIYEKVIDNIKSLCKLELHTNLTNQYQNQENFDASLLKNDASLLTPFEDHIYHSYTEFLEKTKKKIDDLFLINTKEEFIEMMRKKGIEPYTHRLSERRATRRFNTIRILNNLKQQSGDNPIILSSRADVIFNNRNDHDYDEYPNKDDEGWNGDENAEIIKEFMMNEKNKLNEMMKLDRDKK